MMCCDAPNYVEDMCDWHQAAYQVYCDETAPEDRMGPKLWWGWRHRLEAGIEWFDEVLLSLNRIRPTRYDK